MKFWISYRTYNSYGGFEAGSIVSDILENQKVFFGKALEEIEFLLCFQRKNPSDMTGVKKSLWNMHYQFHNKFCETLPYHKFERNKKRLVITALANFGTAQELKNTRESDTLQKEWVASIFDQLIFEIDACRKKFKPSDDFEYDAFVEYLKTSRKKIPQTENAAKQLRFDAQKRFNLERQAMSDWEKLGLDWENFHTKSQKIVPFPKLWSCIDDFSPNGNDIGADILESVRENKVKLPHSLDKSKQTYEVVLAQSGIQIVTTPDDSTDYDFFRKSIVGLAFSYLKLKGTCPHWLVNYTISEIDKYCTYLSTNHPNWEYYEEALKYQSLMKKCLVNFSGLEDIEVSKISHSPNVKLSSQTELAPKQKKSFWKKLFNW